MLNNRTPQMNTSEFSRCEERNQKPAFGDELNSTQKSDAHIKEKIYDALWQDEAIRALEYSEIDVHVVNGVVHLYGHILGSNSQARVENALRDISGILNIRNNLVLDDKLTYEVATSLAALEDTYDCKFFTGSSHGVVTLNGKADTLQVKLLAEKCAASNSNVRGVMNRIQVVGDKSELQAELFLQPTIGETIYFLDWASGIVKQVIINPNNRRVIAMVVYGKFNAYRNLNSQTEDLAEQLITVPMNTIRYLNNISGFLNIHSNEKNCYTEFERVHFLEPHKDWLPPYPYCADNVLLSIESQTPTSLKTALFPFDSILDDSVVRREYFTHSSFDLDL